MKLEIIKNMSKMVKGESLYPRTDEQGKKLIEDGYAKEVDDDTAVEKELVLLNPEPGTYTTALVDKAETSTVAPKETKAQTTENKTAGKKK